MRSQLRKALPEDLRWVTPHSFRRTVATVVNDSLGPAAAQRQLDHRKLDTTETHYIVRPSIGPGGNPMTPKTGKPTWFAIASIATAAIMIVLAIGGMLLGEWLLSLGVLVGAGIIIASFLAVFRVAVTREPDAVVCRYVPWYEPGPVAAVPALAVSGILGLALAFQPGNSPVFAVFGVALLALTPVVALKFLRGYRRCFLRITPTALRVPDPGREWAVTDIPRERIQSIAPAGEAAGFGSSTYRVTDITYGTGDSGSAARTVRVGQAPAEDTVWLTLDPSNLRLALHAWKDGDPNDPGLMDRVEAILRGKAASA
jgi:hypothetical protein